MSDIEPELSTTHRTSTALVSGCSKSSSNMAYSAPVPRAATPTSGSSGSSERTTTATS